MSNVLTAHFSPGDVGTSMATHCCDAGVAPLPTQLTSCGGGIVTPDLKGGDIDEGEEVSLAQRRT